MSLAETGPQDGDQSASAMPMQSGRGRRRRGPLPPIVFKDRHLVVFDKPSGLSVAPDPWNPTGTCLMALARARLGRELANVYRLDADTSGLILCARHKMALDRLSGQFQSKTVVRKLFALVVVLPPERAEPAMALARTPTGELPDVFRIDLPLGPDENNPGRMRAFRGRGGKPSASEFVTRERFGRFALVECRPISGRPHQIRVHLAAAGAPILNDSFYGDPGFALLLSDLKRGYKGREEEKPLIARLALHSAELVVRHPVNRLPIRLHAPLPPDFRIALRYLRRFGNPAGRRSPASAARSEDVNDPGVVKGRPL